MAGNLCCTLWLHAAFLGLFAAQAAFFVDQAAKIAPFVRVSVPVSYVLICALALLTALRDPGSIVTCPRAESKEKRERIFRASEQTAFLARVCGSCGIAQPPAAKHCGCCNRCVVFFDHHCAYLNTDVGMRNYLPFLGLLGAVVLFFANALFCLILGVVLVCRQMSGRELPVVHLTLAVLLGYFSLVGLYFGCNMLRYHGFLLRADLTTNLHIKRAFSIYIDYAERIQAAGLFLGEFDAVFAGRAWIKRFPLRWRRPLLGFAMPRLTKLPREQAIRTAWAYAIATSGLQGHLPEKILRAM